MKITTPHLITCCIASTSLMITPGLYAQNGPPLLEKYTQCLTQAIAAEKTKPSPSADNVRAACTAERQAMTSQLPPGMQNQILDHINHDIALQLGDTGN